MQPVTRREVLYGLISTSLLYNTTPQKKSQKQSNQSKGISPGTSGQLTRLNVMVHGLCITSISSVVSNGILLVLPTVQAVSPSPSDHVYRAGCLNKAAATHAKMLDPTFLLTFSNQYQLFGPKPGVMPSFPAAINLLFPTDSKVTVNIGNNRSIALPWPTYAYSLAIMERSDGSKLLTIKSPYSSDFNGLLGPVATTQLFVYEDFAAQPVLLNQTTGTDTNWKPIIDFTGNATLHIFAEPQNPTDPGHAKGAFTAMIGLLSRDNHTLDPYYLFNDFNDNTFVTGGDNGPHAGIDSLDLKHLSWFINGKGGEVANCVSSIVYGS